MNSPAPENPCARRATRALVVEDNVMIGFDAESLLHDLGIAETVVVCRVADALEELRTTTFDFALLDINLGEETAFPVADALLDLGMPFAFASGYGVIPDMAQKFASVPILQKPYDTAAMRDVVNASLGS